MFHVMARCGWCQERGEMIFNYVMRFTPRDPAGPTPSEARAMGGMAQQREAGPVVEGAAATQCPHCAQPSLVVFKTRERYLRSIIENLRATEPLLGGDSLVTVTRMCPPPPEAEQDPAWPAEILRQFKDAQNMLADKVTPSIIIGVCRTVLDIVTRKLGAREGNLKERIDRLREVGTITTPIADWAHGLRLEGNAAVHEGEGEEAAAREYVEFLRMLMTVTFTLPARIAAKRNAAVEAGA